MQKSFSRNLFSEEILPTDDCKLTAIFEQTGRQLPAVVVPMGDIQWHNGTQAHRPPGAPYCRSARGRL